MNATALPFSYDWIQGGLPSGSCLSEGVRARFSGISTDSRKVLPSELFIAIRGEKFDGHDFISAVLETGVKGILGDQATLSRLNSEIGLFKKFPQTSFFGVQDVQQAYRDLGSHWRSQFKIPVIVVAGSNGKTTTKEFLAAVLKGRWNSVLKTTGSQNGFLGIPMTLLELRDTHGAAVIEVGIDDVGAMAQHIACVRPTHAVLTVIGPEHLENLKDVATVAREELLALSETVKIGGKIAVHTGDPWIAPAASGAPRDQALCFALDEATPPIPPSLIGKLDSGKLVIAQNLGQVAGFELTLPLPLPGRHNAQNLLAAVAVAKLLGLTPEEMLRGHQSFTGAEGRSQVRALPPSRQVICDYYNASPVSMQAAFELLASTGDPQAHRWACLADMKELGENELQFHRDLAPPLLAARPQGILLHGPRMKSLEAELRERNFSGVLEHFESTEALARSLLLRLGNTDVVLIKGSRSMKMEKVWELLQS